MEWSFYNSEKKIISDRTFWNVYVYTLEYIWNDDFTGMNIFKNKIN